MKRRVFLLGAPLVCATPLLGATLSLLADAARAEDFAVGDLKVGNPWARATPRGASVAAAYFTIINNSGAPDRLLSGSTNVATRFEVHRMVIEDGVAKMRPVEGGLEIKARETVELKPGSFHVMLMGLKEPIQEGQRVTGTLVFERAGKVDIAFTVLPIGGSPGGHSGHH
jgi:copper(I)-binding protein